MAELLDQPMVGALVTLTCVSNYVGGGLAGNTVWTGWPVRELLARARPLPEADMVLSTRRRLDHRHPAGGARRRA